MKLCKAYRTGLTYVLEPPRGEQWKAITIALAEGVRMGRSADGELMLYRGAAPFGKQLAEAMRSGWCLVAEGMCGEPV